MIAPNTHAQHAQQLLAGVHEALTTIHEQVAHLIARAALAEDKCLRQHFEIEALKARWVRKEGICDTRIAELKVELRIMEMRALSAEAATRKRLEELGEL